MNIDFENVFSLGRQKSILKTNEECQTDDLLAIFSSRQIAETDVCKSGYCDIISCQEYGNKISGALTKTLKLRSFDTRDGLVLRGHQHDGKKLFEILKQNLVTFVWPRRSQI